MVASSGGLLAALGLLGMNARWRSLKHNYGVRVAEHGVKLRHDLTASLQRELERVYGKRFETMIDMYSRAHGHTINKIDDRAFQVADELRVVRNIIAELKKASRV